MFASATFEVSSLSLYAADGLALAHSLRKGSRLGGDGTLDPEFSDESSAMIKQWRIAVLENEKIDKKSEPTT